MPKGIVHRDAHLAFGKREGQVKVFKGHMSLETNSLVEKKGTRHVNVESQAVEGLRAGRVARTA